MTAIAIFTVPSDAFELGRTLQFPTVEIDLFQLVPRGNRFVPYVWIELDDYDYSEFEDKVNNDFRIERIYPVDEHNGEKLYRIDWATEVNGLFAGFRTYQMSIDRATGSSEEWQFRVFNRDHESLAGFQEHCNEHDIPIQINQVYHPTPPDEPRDWGLTKEQREGIITAFENGYFDVPQESTLEEIGDQIGISRQATGDRINRGLKNLISQTIIKDQSSERL
jgi:predicted DNA binding protein